MHSSDTADSAERRCAGRVVFADADAAALLRGKLDELCRPPRARWEQVKHNSSRTVYRGRIGGQDIFLKHFHSRRPIHHLRRLIGQSDAVREMRFSQYLARHGVPTVPALAAMCDRGVAWLATRAVAPSETADRWHAAQLARGPEGLRAVRRATVALAEVIGRMHAAGVIHRDLHCGNILVRTDRRADRLVLTDLHRAVRRRRLSRRARAANLAHLLHDRRNSTTRADRVRFLRHYLRVSGGAGTLRGWQLLVEDFARRHTRRLFRRRDQRVLGTNRYFARLRMDRGWRGHVVLASKVHPDGSGAAEAEFTEQAWRRALRDPEGLLSGAGCGVLKHSQSTLVVRRSLTIGEHTVDVVVKRRRRKRAWKVLVDCFRPARSIRTFRLGHILLTRQVATALPLAALERRIGPFLTGSILITETVTGTKLNDFLNMYLACPPGDAPLTAAQQRRLARQMLRQMGRLLRKLNDNCLAHRDMKANNLLVRGSPGACPELVLVDLDGLQYVRVLTTRRRFQGLMRLNVSLLNCPAVNHAGRLRMLLGYMRRPGCGRIHYKPYWRVLEKWSASKLSRQIRSRRHAQRAVRQRHRAAGRAAT